MGLSHRELGYVVGERAAQRPAGISPREEQAAHVRDVEDAGPLPHRPVLLDDARVLHRHLPASEGGEARAQRSVLFGER